jgi:hypothetical protein
MTMYLNNGEIINSGNLMSIKDYIKYWKHFTSTKHDLTLELNTFKLLNQANTIKNNYNVYKLII